MLVQKKEKNKNMWNQSKCNYSHAYAIDKDREEGRLKSETKSEGGIFDIRIYVCMYVSTVALHQQEAKVMPPIIVVLMHGRYMPKSLCCNDRQP